LGRGGAPPRLTPLAPEQLTPAARAVYEAITGGRRGGDAGPVRVTAADGSLQGPFDAMLRSPRIGNVVQRLGELLRYESVLPATVREVVILTVARAWRSRFEWHVHAVAAQRAGLPVEVLEALRAGRRPETLGSQEAAAFDLCRSLHRSHAVPQELYERAREQLGEQGLVEAVFLFGYYVLISATLSAFDVGVPGGAPDGSLLHLP
jgi:4-carboxymuconolactone decarboxylase